MTHSVPFHRIARQVQDLEHEPQQKVWICGCENQDFILFADGSVYCPSCNCINTRLRVIDTHAPPAAQ